MQKDQLGEMDQQSHVETSVTLIDQAGAMIANIAQTIHRMRNQFENTIKSQVASIQQKEEVSPV